MVVKEIIHKHLSYTSIPEFFDGEYWPSQIWYCLRKQYYSRISPIPMSLESKKFTTLGTIIHEFIAETLKKEESVRVESEVPIRIPHPNRHDIVISGRADDIIIVTVGKSRYVVEVKTIDDLESKRSYLPKKEHIAQLNLYLRAYPNSKGIILYVDRGSFEMEEFEISFNPDLFNETIKRVEMLHDYLIKRELPPPEAKENQDMKWQCDFCEYRAKCEKQISSNNNNNKK
jgi:CRISPR-associated exonuclease Cas4